MPCFNPRAREDATDNEVKLRFNDDVSIHAPVRTRLAAAGRRYRTDVVSIHAPVRTRPIAALMAYMAIKFQSTRP
ncbi:hypothetical protein XTPLMG728_1271 [Xanthomonas translucens pv. poae]|uniref:Uncharacterized protein n=1 Tax=Xanthomonas graminis pv. poae TaxID=227946 RepID=A0A0K2ZQV6_9XANT|nr:hypothetical protein XTPLMG728_1271 [Xanthomonas translucens pv. poae]